MAAKETVNNLQNENESIVNRWLVDYYYCCFLDMFKKDQYNDFCAIRGVVENILVRPVQTTDVMPTKIRVLQFLSRVNEGEKLDMSFDSDQSVTPLESALTILENMNDENIISPDDFQKISTSLKDMIVGILIKNNEFDQAKGVLTKHFPKPMVGKKAIFMGLIRQKSKTHEVIEKINFQQFKEEMLAFCQGLCPFSVPFLHQAAKRLVDERKAKEDDRTAGTVEQDEPGPSCHLPVNIIHFVPCKHTIILRTRLEAAYNALSAGSDERTFAQLEEEVEREEQTRKDSLSLHPSFTRKKSTSQDSEQNQEFQRDSGSPMEASPADEPTQTDPVPQTQAGSLSKTPVVLRSRRPPYSLARLVVEPDSQGSLQSTASQEPQAELRTEEPPPSPAKASNKNNTRASTRLAELSVDKEEEPARKRQNKSNSSRKRSTRSKRMSSDSDEDTQESPSRFETPRKPARDPLSKDQGNESEHVITDSSLDSSPSLFPLHPAPRTSSTPQQGDGAPYRKKWKQLYNNAKESKDTWSDEETYFNSRKKSVSKDESTISNSGQRRKKWSETETQMLREGVEKFGEGNWSKIKAYYSFKDRTNVQLKDRWRTMKKSNLV
uniref:telomeric repeat binding factor a n=1 Tax=Semicossyphus pulcher TaxID=241346 RepID=UPI0037E7707E